MKYASHPDELLREQPSHHDIEPTQYQGDHKDECEADNGVCIESKGVAVVVDASPIEVLERNIAIESDGGDGYEPSKDEDELDGGLARA